MPDLPVGVDECRTPRSRPDPDADLVARAQQGDLAAQRALLIKYHAGIYGRAILWLHDETLATLATDDVFCDVFSHLHGFRGEATFFSWLWMVAERRIGKWAAKQRTTRSRMESGGFYSEIPPHRMGGRRDDPRLRPAPHEASVRAV